MNKCIPINPIKTAENLKQIRKERGITVKEVQAELGLMHPQAIYKWENGMNLPSIDNCILLAQIYDVPMDNLFVRGQ